MTAIQAFTDEGEPWCSVSVNLSDYGLVPQDGDHIYIPLYKLDDIFAQFSTEELKEIAYGNENDNEEQA